MVQDAPHHKGTPADHPFGFKISLAQRCQEALPFLLFRLHPRAQSRDGGKFFAGQAGMILVAVQADAPKMVPVQEMKQNVVQRTNAIGLALAILLSRQCCGAVEQFVIGSSLVGEQRLKVRLCRYGSSSPSY
jgi:hypothetical protein